VNAACALCYVRRRDGNSIHVGDAFEHNDHCALCNPATLRTRYAWITRPITQVSSGHLLVVSQRHAAYLWDLKPWEYVDLIDLARRTSLALIQHGAHGVNVLHASGEAAGQSVMHAHLHVVPRLRDDGLDLWLQRDDEL